MAVDRRRELIDAGLRLAAELRFQDLLRSVETRAVAEAAGVTTGSFFHHFRSRRMFALAVADRWQELWAQRVERLVAHSVGAADETRDGALREAADDEWAALSAPGVMESVQRLLWGLRTQPLADGSTETAGDLLAGAYRQLGQAVRADYARGLRAMGREPMPPFTPHDMEVVTTALAEGLQLRAAVDAEAVRHDLYRDAVSAFLLGGTRPRHGRDDDPDDDLDLGQVAGRLGRPAITPSEGRATPPDGGAGAPARWRRIADAAAHLFVDRSPLQVRVSEVAACAGVGKEVVRHEFESVVAVAAAGWVRHIPELEAVASASSEHGDDPLRRVEAVLLRYVELGRENRGHAEALVTHFITQLGPAGDDVRRDLRTFVPIPAIVAPFIEELRRAGRLRRRIEIERLSRSLVHLVTVQALMFPGETPERVVDEVMTMVFDGALVEPSDA